MILRRLYEYALSLGDEIPPMGMELKEIEYVVVIDHNGHFVRFESKRIDKRRCTSFLVSKAVSRTSAPKTNTLWDNGKYVFGFEKSHEKYHSLFVERVKEIRRRHPDNPGITAMYKFYESSAEKRKAEMEKDPMYEDVASSLAKNFSFRLDSEDKLIAEDKSLYLGETYEEDEQPRYGRCLVTGEYGRIVRTTTPTPIPDNSPMAALISFQINSGYDSYGKTQAYNSPISIQAESLITAALKKLLSKDSRNKIRIGNRMFLFWSSGDPTLCKDLEDGFSLLLDVPDKKRTFPDQISGKVHKLVKSIYSGAIKTTLDDRFHILGLSPNTGRISVVMWTECSLQEFAQHISAHFNDMGLTDIRRPQDQRPYFGVYSILSAITREGKLSGVLPNIVSEVTAAIVTGGQYPYRLYTSAIERIRAELNEHRVSIHHASILKAYINRKNKYNNSHKPLQVMLDKSNTNPGYLCGRLTAVLETIQEKAGNGDSIRTRYMSAASSTPSSVFPAMLNLSVHHLEKLTPGSRIYLENIKQEIIDLLPVSGFPSHLDINDQGRFFVGYYHQRAYIFSKKEKSDTE